jgi:hypothetical protein
MRKTWDWSYLTISIKVNASDSVNVRRSRGESRKRT